MYLRYQPIYRLSKKKGDFIEGKACDTIEEAEQSVVKMFTTGSRQPIISWYIVDLKTGKKVL